MKQNKIIQFYQIDAVLNIKKLFADLTDISLKSITLNYFIFVLISLIINIFFQDMFVEKLSAFLKKIPSIFVYAPIIEAHFKFLPYYLGGLVCLHFFLPLLMIFTSYFYSIAYDSDFKNMFKLWYIALQFLPLLIALPFFIGIFLLLSFFICHYLNYIFSKTFEKSYWHTYFIIQQLTHIILITLYCLLVF